MFETIDVSRFISDENKRRHYHDALHRLSMGRVSVLRLANLAGIDRRAVKAALDADPRYQRVPHPGPALYQLRTEYRHKTKLQDATTAAVGTPDARAAAEAI
jgi:hypothetical protein